MKERVIQVSLEGLPQFTNVPVVPQVSNGITVLLPDMLLQVQVWTSRREIDHIELFMSLDNGACFTLYARARDPTAMAWPVREDNGLGLTRTRFVHPLRLLIAEIAMMQQITIGSAIFVADLIPLLDNDCQITHLPEFATRDTHFRGQDLIRAIVV